MPMMSGDLRRFRSRIYQIIEAKGDHIEYICQINSVYFRNKVKKRLFWFSTPRHFQ